MFYPSKKEAIHAAKQTQDINGKKYRFHSGKFRGNLFWTIFIREDRQLDKKQYLFCFKLLREEKGWYYDLIHEKDFDSFSCPLKLLEMTKPINLFWRKDIYNEIKIKNERFKRLRELFKNKKEDEKIIVTSIFKTKTGFPVEYEIISISSKEIIGKNTSNDLLYKIRINTLRKSRKIKTQILQKRKRNYE